MRINRHNKLKRSLVYYEKYYSSDFAQDLLSRLQLFDTAVV